MTLSILIVEDEPIIAMDLEDVLLDAGHRIVAIAGDMHEALEVARTQQLDAAIMDVDLALGTNGFETARRLRMQFDVGSLFVSGRLTPQLRSCALQWRPIGFVDKPFRGGDVVRALASIPSSG